MDEREAGGPSPGPGSPGSVLRRLQTRFRQTGEDLLIAREQNTELEKRIKTLTEDLLAANEEKENLKAEHRSAVCRLEEAALTERRRYENVLCSVRQQQQRCQMDLELATEEVAALRAETKTLQMDKVSMARRVRDLESEVKARCRLQQNASDQMICHNQAKHKLTKEMSGLVEWLKRLEAEARSAADLNRRLGLQLRHQGLRLEQLTAPPAGPGVAVTCAELEQLRALLASWTDSAGGAGAGREPTGPQSGPPDAEVAARSQCDGDGHVAPSLIEANNGVFSNNHEAADSGDGGPAQTGAATRREEATCEMEQLTPLLVTVPQLPRGRPV